MKRNEHRKELSTENRAPRKEKSRETEKTMTRNEHRKEMSTEKRDNKKREGQRNRKTHVKK